MTAAKCYYTYYSMAACIVDTDPAKKTISTNFLVYLSYSIYTINLIAFLYWNNRSL